MSKIHKVKIVMIIYETFYFSTIFSTAYHYSRLFL